MKSSWSKLVSRSLIRNEKGTALVELGITAPVLIFTVFAAGEFTNYMSIRQELSSVTRMVADNAARIGEDNTLEIKRVTETGINDVLLGGMEQSPSIDIRNKGRIILSSLEQNASQGQWIHWQRCVGNLSYSSTQGVEGDGKTGTSFLGMGTSTPKLRAPKNSAIMYVEVAYEYTPLLPQPFFKKIKVTDTAAFHVREQRDLTQVYNDEGAPKRACSNT